MTIHAAEFSIWALAIVAGLAAVMLYQHSVHTQIVLGAIAGRRGIQASGQASLDFPQNIAVQSSASGVWSPLGPDTTARVFSYNPPQNWQ